MIPWHTVPGDHFGARQARPGLAGQLRLEASTGSRLPSSAGLLLRLTKNAATRARTAMTTRTIAMIVLPEDRPDAVTELTCSSLTDARAPLHLPLHRPAHQR